MAILHTHRNAILYLDRVRVFMQDDVLVHEAGEGAVVSQWNIPSANTAVLLLGKGTSITDAAMRRLAEDGVMLGFTGTGGVPLLMASMNEYRPTARFQAWIRMWCDEAARLDAARSFARLRIEKLLTRSAHAPTPGMVSERTRLRKAADAFQRAIPTCGSVAELMGYEGSFTKAVYASYARAFQVEWEGRDNRRHVKKDAVNRLIDHGNYLLYGCAAVALWCYGIPPSLPVTHGASRAGGLVFDLADIWKDAIVLRHAFASAAAGEDENQFRGRVIRDIGEINPVADMMAAIDGVIR